MNDPSFLEKTDVNEQDEFFHQFFVERARRDELKGITRHAADEDSDDDDSIAEDQAFDTAEEAGGMGTGNKTFEEYEAMWERDDEEEAFVDSLAMSLMEDSGGGPADIDEDPAEDWGDLYADESDDEKEQNDESVSDDDSSLEENATKPSKKSRGGDEDDDDAFMEDADSNSENGNSSNESDLDEDQIVAGLGVDTFGVEEDEPDVDDDSDDMEADGIFLSDEESDAEEMPPSKKRKKGDKISEESVFADADDYAAMIEESFNKLKSEGQDEASKIENDDEEAKPSKKKQKSSKKRRRKNSKWT